jgi:hypothetical protein
MVADHQSRERKAAVRSSESASGQRQTFADVIYMVRSLLKSRHSSMRSTSPLWANSDS